MEIRLSCEIMPGNLSFQTLYFVTKPGEKKVLANNFQLPYDQTIFSDHFENWFSAYLFIIAFKILYFLKNGRTCHVYLSTKDKHVYLSLYQNSFRVFLPLEKYIFLEIRILLLNIINHKMQNLVFVFESFKDSRSLGFLFL